MTNNVPRPPFFNSLDEMEGHFWSKADPLAMGPQGPEGPQGIPGPRGLTGERGDDGQAVRIRLSVDVVGDLPSSGAMSIGDGALVGTVNPRVLWVVVETGEATTGWVSAGPVTAGPKGDQGDPGEDGPVGPQPPLAGSGAATTAARSDHNHTGVYSPATHNHAAAYAVKSMEGRIASVDGWVPGGTSFTTAATVDYLRFTDGIEHDTTSGQIAVFSVDWTKAARASHSHTAGDISGTLSAAQVPGLDASKITTGAIPYTRLQGVLASQILSGTIPLSVLPNLPASQVTSGLLSVSRIPTLPLTHLFPTNKTVTGTGSFRSGPGNTHAVIATFGATGVFDTGIRQTTDEAWGYVFQHSWGFGWIAASRL